MYVYFFNIPVTCLFAGFKTLWVEVCQQTCVLQFSRLAFSINWGWIMYSVTAILDSFVKAGSFCSLAYGIMWYCLETLLINSNTILSSAVRCLRTHRSRIPNKTFKKRRCLLQNRRKVGRRLLWNILETFREWIVFLFLD